MREARQLLRLARELLAGNAEKELERLLRVVLKGTPFAGKVHAVGGYVRDELLGVDSKDLDVVVEMRDGAQKFAQHVHQLFPEETSRPRRLGSQYPIWEIAFKADVEHKGNVFRTKGAELQFADTQKESFPDADTRQRVVEYGTLQEDIARRDFTVNMLLKDLATGEITDLTGTSARDLEKGVLRGHPGVDFGKILSDDPLRMIRL